MATDAVIVKKDYWYSLEFKLILNTGGFSGGFLESVRINPREFDLSLERL
jgi:hypothetical protein